MNKSQQLAVTCHIAELVIAVCAIITGVAQLVQINVGWKSTLTPHEPEQTHV